MDVRQRSQFSLFAHLLIYGLLIGLPIAALLGAFMLQNAVNERAQLDERLLNDANSLGDAVDREIERRRAVLDTLATSPALKAHDWHAFYEQAKAATGERSRVLVIDAAMHQVLNTRLPFGQAPNLTADPETAQRVLATGLPQTSDLFRSQVTQEFVINLELPYFEDGKVTYVLALALQPEDFTPLLQGQRPNPGWAASIVDGNDRLLARSRLHEKLAGTLLPPHLRQSTMTPNTVMEKISLDGYDMLLATAVLKNARWWVAIGVPQVDALAPLRRSMLAMGCGLVATLLIAVLGGARLSRLIVRPIRNAQEAATALAHGQPVLAVSSQLKEANELNAALVQAQQELQRRGSALQTAADEIVRHSRQFDVLLRVTPAAIWISRDPSCHVVIGNPLAHKLWGVPDGENASATPADGAPLPTVHLRNGGEVPAKDLPLQRAIATGQVIEEQFDLRRPDGSERTVAGSAAPLRGETGNIIGAIAVFLDITDLKRIEARQRLLIGELNHRVKNTLAVVQSIAAQSLRSTKDPMAFEKVFMSRLSALASAHNLLTQREWSGAPLRDLVLASLTPFKAVGEQVALGEGPDVSLPAEITISLALMLHELGTNAAKHGALSTPDGRVSISWSEQEVRGRRGIELRWVETGGPAVVRPAHNGFGSRLFETVAAQLDGELHVLYPAEGFQCRFLFPLSENTTAPVTTDF